MMRAYVCCGPDGCGAFQAAYAFFHEHGLEPEVGQDERGRYFEFRIPGYWTVSKMRRFKAALREEFPPLPPPCFCCGSVPAAPVRPCDCGTPVPVCEECLDSGPVACPGCAESFGREQARRPAPTSMLPYPGGPVPARFAPEELPLPKLVSKQDVAAALGVPERAVDRLRVQRALRGVRVGRAYRFEPAEVERFIRDNSGR